MVVKRKAGKTKRETVNPVARFNAWFRQARRAGNPLPEAMALATADRHGWPAVRWVLLKDADGGGFVFYTNADSAKGRELRDNPRASLAVYWHETGRQVRITGRITAVSAAEADAYWETRPLESRLAALASRQSAPLASRSALVARWRSLKRRYGKGPIPRPAYWTGFRLRPSRVEFWTRREPRLHERELFVCRGGVWTARLLQP